MFVKQDTLRGSGGSLCRCPDLGAMSLSRAEQAMQGGTILGTMRLDLRVKRCLRLFPVPIALVFFELRDKRLPQLKTSVIFHPKL